MSVNNAKYVCKTRSHLRRGEKQLMKDRLPHQPELQVSQIEKAMADLYDHYYVSHEYSKRYPKPNETTLEFLFGNGAENARNVLDYGCGNGRYALPLLQKTSAHVTAFDISAAAIDELATHLHDTSFADRARLVHGDAGQLNQHGKFDLVLMMFGVLSHVGDRAARLATLRQLRNLMHPQGKLILSVPSIFRRRPFELLRTHIQRVRGTASETKSEPGNILFTRSIASEPHQFFYHLYSVAGLTEEMREAGFRISKLEPESLLPEWMITQFPLLGKLDAALLPLLPAALGYGICAVAELI
ncbi:MAG TPA: class I SAM-dependent methyltransferase [Burkholderiaceae bacterium]|jgi:2-polyprenyl-3-methyl-5-hydroxy-6-metoxy-1,4-benzoquinol methylase|nr:class I SAM-dependent methyltransferase [Burkholderiaceae bacterium]